MDNYSDHSPRKSHAGAVAGIIGGIAILGVAGVLYYNMSSEIKKDAGDMATMDTDMATVDTDMSSINSKLAVLPTIETGISNINSQYSTINSKLNALSAGQQQELSDLSNIQSTLKPLTVLPSEFQSIQSAISAIPDDIQGISSDLESFIPSALAQFGGDLSKYIPISSIVDSENKIIANIAALSLQTGNDINSLVSDVGNVQSYLKNTINTNVLNGVVSLGNDESNLSNYIKSTVVGDLATVINDTGNLQSALTNLPTDLKDDITNVLSPALSGDLSGDLSSLQNSINSSFSSLDSTTGSISSAVGGINSIAQKIYDIIKYF